MIGEVYSHVTRYVAQDTMQKMKGQKAVNPGEQLSMVAAWDISPA